MAELADRLRTRLIPAILTALGVTMIAVGLLSYSTPADAGRLDSPAPTQVAVHSSPSPLITLPPIGSAPPATASPTIPADRVATRVRIRALGIDLPIFKQPGGAGAYPLCDVAMYIEQLGQPGEGRATYLYAHARQGMFLPILTASKIANGKQMLGMVVEVYTSDDQRFLYYIVEVRRHQRDLNDAISATSEELWLQTSEGPAVPKGQTPNPKLEIVAMPLSQEAADPAEAHPIPKPVACG
jgi:Sortase family.